MGCACLPILAGDGVTKVILSANTDWYLYNFRLSLSKAIRSSGVDLLLASPLGPYVSRIKEEGLRWRELPMSRRGFAPSGEMAALLRFFALYSSERPDLVHHFTIKPVLYGSLAARWARILAVVNSITGLGYVFVNPGKPAALLRPVVRRLYRSALAGSRVRVIFQNARQREQFLREGLADAERSVVIPGSGVDPERYRPRPEPSGEPVVLMAGRMLWDKGIGELVAAARLLRQQGVQVRFVLVGAVDDGNPASVPEKQLCAWQEEGVVRWLGHQDDMPEVLGKCHIVALPSYGEGIPKALIEAAAAGKPIVATDVAGCRDVVQDGVNGLLVAPRDVEQLAGAIRRLASDASLRGRMGEAGRARVLKEFADEHINRETLWVYRELLPDGFG